MDIRLNVGTSNQVLDRGGPFPIIIRILLPIVKQSIVQAFPSPSCDTGFSISRLTQQDPGHPQGSIGLHGSVGRTRSKSLHG